MREVIHILVNSEAEESEVWEESSWIIMQFLTAPLGPDSETRVER